MDDGGIFVVLKDQPEDVQLVSSDFIVIEVFLCSFDLPRVAVTNVAACKFGLVNISAAYCKLK